MNINIIGPFIGVERNNKLKVVIATPKKKDTSKINCLFESDDIKESVSAKSSNQDYKNFVFPVPEKFKGKKVSYTFTVNDASLELEGGLIKDDCVFVYDLNFHSEEDYFALLSCNNPFVVSSKKGGGSPWAMWDKLEQETRSSHCKLILLGGDQVYCDDLENGKLNAPKAVELKKGDEKKLRNDFINQYLKYWSNLSLRKILARTPSLAMWDDHDITDGWGSRSEFLNNKKNPKENWQIYFEEAKGAFEAYQAIRNPKAISENTKFTTFIDFGSTRFYLADFRSERNSSEQILWSKQHETDCINHIDNTDSNITNIYFLSPVIGMRTNIGVDERMSFASNFLKRIAQSRKKRGSRYNYLIFCIFVVSLSVGLWLLFTRGIFVYSYLSFFSDAIVQLTSMALLTLSMLLYLVPWSFNKFIVDGPLSGLSDDLDDALSSKPNISAFRKILKSLFQQVISRKNCSILSGDIHAGGISEFLMKKDGSLYQIPQIVSSPIGYHPMPKAVEGLTTTTSEMIYSSGGESIIGRNLFYISKRNFAKVYPDKKYKNIEFYFEGHSEPYCIDRDATKKYDEGTLS